MPDDHNAYKFPDIHEDYDEKKPWEFDVLDRQEHADILTLFLSGTKGPFVLAINAGWGQGKSLFLRMWRDDLVHLQHRPCVLFNAWENDFGDDPLVALMGAVSDYVEEGEAKDKGGVQKATVGIWRKGWAFAKTARPHLVKSGLRYLATKGLDLAAWDDDAREAAQACAGDDDAAKELCDILAGAAADMYTGYLLQKESMEGFKIQLEALAKELTGEAFPLIIMVDELDRCRPDYALLTLERIKHLFCVPGVVFVLALEGKSLARTVNRLYGLGLGDASAEANGQCSDSEVYLRRFIDLEYRLPEPSKEAFAAMLCQRFRLTPLHNPDFEWPRDLPQFRLDELLAQLSEAFSLSLRDMGQIAAQAAATARAYQATWLQTCVLLILLVLRREASEAYALFHSRRPIGLNHIAEAAKGTGLKDLQEASKGVYEVVFTKIFSSEQAYRRFLDSARENAKNTSRTAHEQQYQQHAYRFLLGHAIKETPLDRRELTHMVEFAARFRESAAHDAGMGLAAVRKPNPAP